jgi:hypothetical protein
MNRPAHAARIRRSRPAARAGRAAGLLLAAGALTAACGTSGAALHHPSSTHDSTGPAHVTTGHLTSQPTKPQPKPQPQPKAQPKPQPKPKSQPATQPKTQPKTQPPQPQPQPATGGPWSSKQLTITPHSLGAVVLGMTLAQAEHAAGHTFDGMGDGFAYSNEMPSGYPHDYVGLVGLDADPVVSCVGAEASTSSQVVVTPEGFRLGQSVLQLKAVYGSRAVFVPPPANPGMTDFQGFVVDEHAGALVFVTDQAGEYVVGIMGGPVGINPNSCTG